MVEQVKTKTEPYVRFRGFTDEWEQVKLGDVVNIRGGGTPKTDVPEYWGGDVQWFTPSEVNSETKFVSESERTITEKGLIHSSAKILPKGSILLTTRASLGDMSILNVDATTNQGFQSLIPTERIDLEFLYGFQKQLKKYCEIHANGSTFLEINKHEVGKFKLGLPSLPEQQKIGELFQTLDNVIDLSNTQVANLKQQKKALLQRLFPQKGETAPTVRLRGFKDAWEEVKLGDVFSVYSKKGRTDLPFVTVSERETNERTASAQGYGNDVSDKARAKAKVLLSGQFLIDLSSYGRGIYMSRMDGVTSSAYNVLNLDNGADSYWVEYLISHDFVESLKRLTPPGARQGKMIEVDGLLKTKTFVPSLEEQQKIGELFQTLDEQIRLAEDKVSQYKELKHALLQRLFV